MIKDQGDVYNDPDVIAIEMPIMEGHDVDYNPVTEIGKIVSPEQGYHLIDSQLNRIPILPKGWDHFQREKE